MSFNHPTRLTASVSVISALFRCSDDESLDLSDRTWTRRICRKERIAFLTGGGTTAFGGCRWSTSAFRRTVVRNLAGWACEWGGEWIEVMWDLEFVSWEVVKWGLIWCLWIGGTCKFGICEWGMWIGGLNEGVRWRVNRTVLETSSKI